MKEPLLHKKKAHPQQIVADKWFRESYGTEYIAYESIDENFLSILNAQTDPLSKTPHLNADSALLNNKTIKKGEFREVIAVFISYANAYEYHELESITKTVLNEFENFGGYFKEIDFSERDGVIVGLFGAPISYENNVHRALECVLAIRDNITHLQAKYPYRMRMGLTSGVAFTGTVGGFERNQYAAVGDRVNLAARLMQKAEWGEILTDKSLTLAKSFQFEEKGHLIYKGVTSEVPTYRLIKKRLENKPFFEDKMVGRSAELKLLINFSNQITSKSKSIVATINGEAGIGKSRLTYELHQKLPNMQWVSCPADQILKKSLNPFTHFLKQFFNQNPDKSIAENKLEFESAFEKVTQMLPPTQLDTAEMDFENEEGQLHAELYRTKSVLAAWAGLIWEDSLWEQLDAKGRYENTLTALSTFFMVLASQKPLVLEIEDAHWLDDDSKNFLHYFIKKIEHYPILCLFTLRYDDEGALIPVFEPEFLNENNIATLNIALNSFSQEDLKIFAERRLKGHVHADFVKTLWRTTNGNPFYAEQIVDYFTENDLLEAESNHYWNIKDKKVKVSTSISSILTARIDRLSFILKETVKTAAVIGREFELPILTEVMLAHDEYRRRNGNGKLVLREQVQTAEKGQIWQAMNELRYIFRHTLLREAIYDMQLKTRVRELHAMIAQAIEKIYTDQLEDRFIDLAFHYEQAGNTPKTNEYLKKAGDYARRNFQNQKALDLYDQLLKNTSDTVETIKILIRKGEVLQLIGSWTSSELCFKKALLMTDEVDDVILKGRTYNALGHVMMLKGAYKDARRQLEKAGTFFDSVNDVQGIILTYGNLGNLYFRQGEYERAKEYYSKSISMSREHNKHNNAQIVSYLGLTYMNQGNYTEGVLCQKEEIKICEDQNDLVGMSTLYVNIGILYTEKGDNTNALKYLETGLSLAQKLGNKQLTSIALGCIGHLWLLKGDFEKAQHYLVEDLKMTKELGDKQGVAIACELNGRLHSTKGEFDEALQFFKESLNLCRELLYQKGIAKALHGMAEIYAYNCDYLKALSHLDEAIAIAQKINNQSILCNCLTDKGSILLKVGDYLGAKTIQNQLKTSIDFSENKRLFNYSKHFLNKI